MTATTVTLQARRGISLVASAASLISVAALLVLLILTILGHRLLVVRSDSMAPALRAGDVVVIQMVRPAGVGPGAIVTFSDHTREGRLVTHRVIERERAAGRMTFKTRGDANTGVEEWSIPTSGRLGSVKVRIPALGRLTAGMTTSPWLRIAVLGTSGVLAAIMALRRIWAR